MKACPEFNGAMPGKFYGATPGLRHLKIKNLVGSADKLNWSVVTIEEHCIATSGTETTASVYQQPYGAHKRLIKPEQAAGALYQVFGCPGLISLVAIVALLCFLVSSQIITPPFQA